jgi:hypothetical protein
MSISVSLKRVTAIAAAIAFVFSAFAVTKASAATCPGTFTLNHKLGQTGGEVMWIQQFLNGNGYTVALSGAGSAGMESSYFGAKTKAAVQKFQAANGVAPVSGYWGPLTRAAANAVCVSGPTTPTTPSTGNATVSAAAQPGNSLAVASAARVPFTKFTVTAGATPVTLNSVTVERGGLAADAAFAGAVLLDDTGAQLGVQQSFNSNHQATVGTPVVIPAGMSKTFTVAANMQNSATLSSYAGQVAVMSVVAVNTNGTIAGSLPITGAQHTINHSLAIGSVTAGISSYDPQSAQNKNIGDTGVRFAALRVTAGPGEDIRFWGVRFRLNGSASASDLSNVKINVDGTDYDATISADGRYFSAMVPGGLKIEKGYAKDLYIKGDITGSNASGRTIQMDIDRRTDILFTGELYGYGITPCGSSCTVSGQTFGTTSTSNTASALQNNSDNPWYQGADIVVTGASVTSIGKASEVSAQNIAVNVPNVSLGGFYTDIKGEPLNVSSIKVDVTYSARPTTADVLTNVSLVDSNGVVVSGPVDEVQTGATTGTVTFSNQVTIPTGKRVWTIKGKVDSDIANNATIILSTTPSSTSYWTNVTGQITGNSVTLPGTSFPMNTMTIRTASLVPGVNSGLAAQTIVAGAQATRIIMVDLDATSSGEDVRLSSVPLTFTVGGALALSHLSACQLWDGATALNTGSNVPSSIAASQTFVLDNSLMVTKGTKKTLTLTCNVQSNVTGTVIGGVPAGASWTGITGVTSGNTITPSNIAGSANMQSVTAGGSYTVYLDASSPSTTLVAGGASNVVLGVLKVRSSNEDVDLTEMLLQAGAGNSSSLAGSQVTIWDGATQVGTASISGTSGIAYFSPALRITKDTDKKLTIKGNLAAIGTNQTGISGSNVTVNYDNDTLASTKATGVSSGTQINPTSTADTTAGGVVTYKSVPTVARLNVPSTTLTTGTIETYRFSVAADAAGDIALGELTVDSSVSGATVTAGSVYVYAYTDAGMSQPVSGFTSGQLNSAGVNAASATAVAINNGTGPLQIPAGSTRYFKVVATVTAAAAGNSITTRILGDATYAASANYTTQAAAKQFVWADNSTIAGSSTLGAGTADWAGGYSVVGLPSLGTDSTVLSKN